MCWHRSGQSLARRSTLGSHFVCCFFFFNDTATTEIYTLSLHDALPISQGRGIHRLCRRERRRSAGDAAPRSEEHTSELQSRLHLVCRLLLEKKKKTARPRAAPTCDRAAGLRRRSRSSRVPGDARRSVCI